MRLTCLVREKLVIPGLTGNLPLVKYSLCFWEYFFYEMAIPELVGHDIVSGFAYLRFSLPYGLVTYTRAVVSV